MASQVHGRWGSAIEVPGTAALNHGDAKITSVSCGSAGNCAAGGFYTPAHIFGNTEAFVVSQVNGRWQKAIEVPGTAALNRGQGAEITSVSCVSAGSCAAGGFYTNASRRTQAFVVIRVRGRWGKAIEVPGMAALNHGDAQMNSVSCASAGNCGAGGFYADASGRTQAFVVSQVRGRWGRTIEVPGTAALNTGGDAQISLNHGDAQVNSMSCASAGQCSAGGYYTDVSRGTEAFVVSETT